jgi:hypothetical protein
MNGHLRYFVGAVILTAYFLLSQGAPLGAVLAGIAGAGLFMWRQKSRLR